LFIGWRSSARQCWQGSATQGKDTFLERGGGFDRNVRDLAEFTRHVRYIHRNPVERGLVEHPTMGTFQRALVDGQTRR